MDAVGIGLYPEICEMQARAIFEARPSETQRRGETVVPEIMIPLVATKAEIAIMKQLVDRVAETVKKETKAQFDYLVGTMIELPRAALRANAIAEAAEFFSFGTNDLTQSTFGLSRDDATSFLATYQKAGIFEIDPFVTLDRKGVGVLIEIAATQGRKTNPRLKLGICGEHGGDPASVAFCEMVKLDYVSCSPYRVPIARLAAAQAAVAPAGIKPTSTA
ncbi:MAG: putative PEP-binding protein [Alphaproteobacteria bacterium]